MPDLFKEYGLKTMQAAVRRNVQPYHLIGLDSASRVLSAALRGEPTGQASGWRRDVVAAPASVASRRDA